MINYLDIQKQLQLNGWYLKYSEIESICQQNPSIDVKKIIQSCLNIDLREIQELDSKGKLDQLNSDVVLQIQKIRNVGAPKDNPESKTAPRLFKLQLTDGNTTYSAIEAETIQAFTMNTAPGTKILLKLKNSSVETANGQLLLKPSNCVVLGGNVSHLVEKWELTRSLAKLGRHGCGAPPFIAFGEKIQQNVPVANDRSFKSLQNNTAKESENENSEFNTQRNDAIAEAYKSGTKKTFGGGTNKLVDSNVQKILEKGYTEEQANQALKFSRNNLEKALSILKRQDEKTNAQRTGDFDTSRKEAGGRGRGGKVAAGSEQPGTTKPSAKVSLFEFLEDKLPHQQENENSTAKMYSTGSSYNASNSQNTNYGNSQKYSSNRNSERFENNISSSFRKNDKENSYSSKSTSSSGAPTKHQLPNNTAVNTQTSVSHTGNASGSTYSGYNKSAHTSQNYNSRQQASGSQQTRDNRDHSSKYSSHGQYGNNYQSNSSAPYRQNSYHERQKNNYHSSSGQQQPYQKQGSPPQQQQQQQPHYASQQKYSQGNQSAGSYQRGKPNSNYQKYDSKHDSRYDSKYEKNYESKYESKYEKSYEKKYDYNSGKSNYNASGNQGYNNQGNSGGSRSNYSGPSNSKYHDNNKGEQQQHHQQNSSYGSKGRQQMVDSMAKMNLNSGPTPVNKSSAGPPAGNATNPTGHKPYNSGINNANKNVYSNGRDTQAQSQVQIAQQQQPPPPTQSQQPQQTAPLNPNDLNVKNAPFSNDFAKINYNPYQIIGFQNKETNEYAKNILKTQQQQPPPQASLPPTQPITSGPPPPTATIYQQATPNPHALPPSITTVIPAQAVFHSNYPIMMAPQIGAAPMTAQPSAPLVNGKAGEYCLAKYWEDGQFYNAKITGVSDNTYVVLFTEYGNHEEVRKADCLPLITTPISSAPSPHPPTFYQASFHPIQLHPAAPMHQQQTKPVQIHHNGNKVMYQPPPQRNGNGNKIHRYNVSKN